ncbi:TonB-dependent receptor [Sphingopyxis sp.]|uniref:TonB-dependent receptor domain-containing protein n=1 Tax=Sphingopyxis sp. TaxID=1908224 RepID=UPI0026104C6F|nr:TonB-dependent receptor [Sphingopyxis sp.]MCW0197376.1 TonB-dependent receptor [Sphingopyxis sp.]
MHNHLSRRLAAAALSGASLAALVLPLSPAIAQTAERKPFDIPAQDAARALEQFGRQSGRSVMFDPARLTGAKSRAVQGQLTPEEALDRLLTGTGFSARQVNATTFVVSPRSGDDRIEPSSTADGDGYRANEIVVTAQKRVESIQDVPIAMTALSQEDLGEQKIESGSDIMRAVPNLTFSKSNFTSYNVSIRGIGTKAISASTDPGVAVSFNNSGLITNRFFEQEFFDLERLEVLRGPQGTLYGRNATGGVINLISAKPKLDRFEGNIKGEVGNFNSRRMVGMLNIPIVPDHFGLRVAGSMTDRDGYDYNSITNNRINGRDLWSLRTTLGFENNLVRGNFIWERFREKDNRSRTGKQLCHRDDSPEMIGSTPTDTGITTGLSSQLRFQRAALFSTGCKAGSLYDDGAFGTPNGLALAYVAGLNIAQATFNRNSLPGDPFGGTGGFAIDPLVDPYGGMMQSRDLREVASIRDPRYHASSDILELNLDIDLTDGLTFSSQSAVSWDSVYSFQDYNRFNTVPIFRDSSQWLVGVNGNGQGGTPSPWRGMSPGGIFCDPQIGCSDRLGVFDISSAHSRQISQEIRLQSSFDGPFNFSIGGNYTKFRTQNDYYVMSNVLTAIAMLPPFNSTGTQTECDTNSWLTAGANGGLHLPIKDSFCPYIDPNPVESINGDGHNYFRSSNPYRLKSYAAFGEAYYSINPDLKLTAGLRYTHDSKRFTLVPSQLLLTPTLVGGGLVGTGYPTAGDVVVKGGEFTGRFGVDWQPDLAFTDDSLLYAFYSRGYKAGGINPPTPGFATSEQWVEMGYVTQAFLDLFTLSGSYRDPPLELTAVNYGATFKPEFVNAFEIGMKNTLMGGRLTLNAGAFYYDYKNYQVSQIRDRTAVNENFDAKVWGAELSALFEPVDRLRLNANVGYLRTRIGKGMKSIDPMNRTLGNPDYVVTKPWVQLPSNCVVPVHVAEQWLQVQPDIAFNYDMCGGVGGFLGAGLGGFLNDPRTGALYDVANYPEINGGAGFYTDLGGKELPNSPHWTVNVGAEYTIPFQDGWSATVRGDGYWQAKSWARVYNLNPYDRLRDWTNFNISLRIDGPDDLSIEAYVKNVFNSTPITDAFLNSDDSGLTTNVFTLDPRIIGFSIAKKF